MKDFWARCIDASGRPGPNYWYYFAQRLADLATIPRGAAILDIGTYDGNVLFKAMKRAGSHGLGVGADIYGGGLKDGVAEAATCGLRNVAFARMDAAQLAFLAETFHIVLANFMGWDDWFDFERMRFIAPDPWAAEIMRVLKPGGQVGIGGWNDQSDIEWIVGQIRGYLPEYVAELDRKSSRLMLSYAKENSEGIEVVLREGGFHDIHMHVETVELVSPDEETWWRQMRQAASEYFEQIPEEGAEPLERFKEQVFANLQPFKSPEGIRFSKTVHFAFGTKSA
jgi:SAM-dependent methyltransferase